MANTDEAIPTFHWNTASDVSQTRPLFLLSATVLYIFPQTALTVTRERDSELNLKTCYAFRTGFLSHYKSASCDGKNTQSNTRSPDWGGAEWKRNIFAYAFQNSNIYLFAITVSDCKWREFSCILGFVLFVWFFFILVGDFSTAPMGDESQVTLAFRTSGLSRRLSFLWKSPLQISTILTVSVMNSEATTCFYTAYTIGWWIGDIKGRRK